MRRCDLHGRFGCADYECQRAESARHAAAWVELRDGGEDAVLAALRPGEAPAVNTTDRDEPILIADQVAELHENEGQ